MPAFTESHVEEAALEWLGDLGYELLGGPEIAPDGPYTERVSYSDVILFGRFRAALGRLNPHLSAETIGEVIPKVQQAEAAA